MKCKPIPGFLRYTITKDGKMISNIKTGAELKQYNIGGYYVTKLFDDENKRVSVRTNRMVALTYIPNPNNFPIVNHKNGITTDNKRKNLEWTTHKGNSEHSEKLNLRKRWMRPVVQMDLEGKEIAEYESVAEASRQTGIDSRYIIGVCRRVAMKSHGFRWRYKDDENWEMPVRRACKAVEKVDMEGNVVEKYKSMGDVMENNDITTHMALRRAIDRNETFLGFKWRFYISEPKLDLLFEETRNWKLIENYNGRVSLDGRIYSDKHRKLRTLTKSPRGYLTVTLGKTRTCQVHQLVAQAYIPNPHNYPGVNHKDGDKTNNAVENLEWANQHINILHSHDMGLQKSRKPIIQYDSTGSEVTRFKSLEEAANAVGVGPTTISGAARGKHKSAAGFVWRFEDNPLSDKENIQIGYTLRVKSPVIQYDKDWDEIDRFDSIMEAEKALGVTKSHISSVCMKDRKFALGFRWKYSK
uniref:Nuclease-associated modular DNA-binding 1 domain-containing protein n=1 Tax=Marseillevirus LCMAC101 TaxID=2506602 RepID=A0A481YSJ9_9VIRU|nr:MAG: uncharacterized protein LCMAC101_00310 [Marseillevirus LCMAC101]